MLLLWIACQPMSPIIGGADSTDKTDHRDIDTSDYVSIVTGTDAKGDEDEAEFFDDSFIHEVAITLSEQAVQDLRWDPYDYTEGSVTVDGVRFAQVGVRLRGKYGSFRDLSGKPKFKIDFNHFVVDQRLGEYEQLALNNEVVDCSYLREPLGYEVFRQLGLPAPRTVFTSVTVNGDDYGLYVAVEFPDDRFLSSRYEDGSGNLYDGKYLYWEETGNYAFVDFSPDLVGNFVLEEGTDVGGADVEAVSEALYARGSFAERLDPVLDLARFHRHLAAEQWTGHIDGYALNTNNYRVYFDREDGKAELLVYDLDYAFLQASEWGMNWQRPQGVLVDGCWRDPDCVETQRSAVAALLADLDTEALTTRLEAWESLIREAADQDPRRECSGRSVGSEQAAMREWVQSESGVLAETWELE